MINVLFNLMHISIENKKKINVAIKNHVLTSFSYIFTVLYIYSTIQTHIYSTIQIHFSYIYLQYKMKT